MNCELRNIIKLAFSEFQTVLMTQIFINFINFPYFNC